LMQDSALEALLVVDFMMKILAPKLKFAEN
jgi:hypothetical protein